uniref:Cytochrome P450 family 2 subfamily B member 6 n=1 Tax=Capra hircus TaxID=9925 RepID=A0A452FU57_CAPHI
MEPTPLSVLLLFALLTGLLILLIRGRPKARGHLPPGPRPLPFLGNLLQMDRKGLLKSFLRKYGDVFTVYLGPRPVVIICGTEAIREALVDQAEVFSGRAKIAVVDPVVQGHGVIFANGERWKALRRFSLATMRDFGMGKRSVEERIQEEAQCLVEELQKSQGALQDPVFYFHSITANIICSIVFGKRFDYRDPQFLRLLELLFQSFVLISSLPSQLFELYSSFLKHFPGSHRQIYKTCRKSTGEGQQAPPPLMGAPPTRLQDKSDPRSQFDHRNLIMSALSLFFAGTETTSTTSGPFFCAERVLKEIDRVIGSDRPPALDDRAKCIHRHSKIWTLLPIGVPHMVTKDTHFRGYILPRYSTSLEVYPILSSALHDSRYFEKPDDFNPAHFLDANGAVKKNDRICLGEGIARTELFLFFTTILQNFSVASPVAPEDIDLTPQESGVGNVPPKYQIRFLPRQRG